MPKVLLAGVRMNAPVSDCDSTDETYFVQSSKAQVFHSKPRCGSSRCAIRYGPHSLPDHLRPCKRCSPTNPTSSSPKSSEDEASSYVFQCIDLSNRHTFDVKIDQPTGDISCSCSAFDEGELCAHIRFVLQRVLDSERWLDTLYEYGGFDEGQTRDFLGTIGEVFTSLHKRKRRCFACLQYVNGLHPRVDSASGRIYHQECFAQTAS